MSTSTGLTYVAGTQCATCSGVNLYNQTESTTAQSFSSASHVPLFGQSTGAFVIKESCELKTANGSQWSYPNQTIIVINDQSTSQFAQDSNIQIGSGLDGLIGLGTNRLPPSSLGNSSPFTAGFADSVFGQYLARNPIVVNFTFGMSLNPPLNMVRGNNTSSTPVSGASSSAGVLHWLQPDPTAYDTSQVSWVTVNNSSAGFTPTDSTGTSGAGDWFVGLDGWVMNSGDDQLANTKSVVATVDPMYTDMYLPADQAKLIHEAIPGSNFRPDLSSLGPLSDAWTIPCDATFSFGLVVGSQTFTLNPDNLIITQPDGTCISGIEGWTDSTQTTYLFGARFLSTIYLIFNIPRDGADQVGFAPRSSSSSKFNHIGAIVGGAIGGAALLIIVAFTIFFFVYRHRRQAYRVTAAQYDDSQGLEKIYDVQPFSLGTPTTVQFPPGPESTAGSSSLYTTSPHAGLSFIQEEAHVDIAPPSYETSEAQIGGSSSSSPTFQNDKSGSYTANFQPGPLPHHTPLTPVHEVGISGSSSAGIY
ncbi:hypothetical protein PHLCEN_2v5713 [Hermanssonia centrifuga]|uniref:Peptidase A1 domain-containing protein n=1 Tax=Hermanssonia centrifuga TaxID=98765 RepID=A0A2R6P1H2_9APHY|nr:hypothetical protein PHLCEN_2v5713 [Hermanssonia centrifuga]